MASTGKKLSGRSHSHGRTGEELRLRRCRVWHQPRLFEPIHPDPVKNARVRHRATEFAHVETADAADSGVLHDSAPLLRDLAGTLSCQAGSRTHSLAFRRSAPAILGQVRFST